MAMPTTGQVSFDQISVEVGSSSGSSRSLNDTTTRRLADGKVGQISMSDVLNKTWNYNFTGTQSAASCYSAQGGFSVDRYGSAGDLYLTMGVWPTDPPNCQTCSWTWLKNGGTGSTTSYNSYRQSTNTRPYWTQVWSVNITSISVGSQVQTRAPAWPYTLVSYTYIVKRTATNSIGIVPYPNSWGTGDGGTSVSISNWWTNVSNLGGGHGASGGGKSGPYVPPDPGQINLSWSSVGY